jgi:GAF domain-containing protein
MTGQLGAWQQHLERHFANLAAIRGPLRQPLFALEHNLTIDELNELTPQLHLRGLSASSLRPYWLLWIVHAAECGYKYAGDEYWPSFEAGINGWQSNLHRDQLRILFKTFAEKYGGVYPTGRWAECFKNIAWPITHAVLPKYLQPQFASVLHASRYELAGLANVTPAAAGQLLANHSYNSSARFEVFLEQEEVAGRILLAMLAEKQTESHSPLYQPAVERIVRDLEQERLAREYLRETRNYIAARFKGAGKGLFPHTSRDAIERREPSIRQSIRPSLLLRRSSRQSWSALFDFPSLADLASGDAPTRDFLKTTRCKVLGSDEGWMPGGWLSYSSQRRVIRNWPDQSQALLRFEHPEKQPGFLRNLVISEIRMNPGPTWLCRVRADGLASEVACKIVRPGEEYIILSVADLSHNRMATATLIDCKGIAAFQLKMPSVLSKDQIQLLEQLGLQVARTVEIWPAGSPARGWDGEGKSEWLTNEIPCFGIKHDHPVDAFLLKLGSDPEKRIAAAGNGQPVFFKLPPLPAGRYTLAITAQRANITLPDTKAHVALSVREPRPWIAATTSHAGLAVFVEPPDADLDALWEGRVKFAVLGPDQRQVCCHLELSRSDGSEIFSEIVGTYTLPVARGEIARSIRATQDRHRWEVVEAASGRIRFSGDELGQYILNFNRSLKPLRWVCRRVGNIATLRLIDDTGTDSDKKPQVHMFEFKAPTIEQSLSYENAVAGFDVGGQGGLYVARHNGHEDFIVVKQASDLAELKTTPHPRSSQVSSENAMLFLKYLSRWGTARTAGSLAKVQRDHTALCIRSDLIASVCGLWWSKAERIFEESRKRDTEIDTLKLRVDNVSYAAAIKNRAVEFDQGSAGREIFADISRRYKVCEDAHECDFAYVWAHDPLRLLQICPDPQPWLSRLSANQVLARGARLVCLLALKNDQEAGA